MQVFAYYTSVITGAEIKFELAAQAHGFAFRNVETGNFEAGTFTDKANKFAALDMFKQIYREMHARFELV